MQLENRCFFFYIHNTPSTPKARRLEPGNFMGGGFVVAKRSQQSAGTFSEVIQRFQKREVEAM